MQFHLPYPEDTIDADMGLLEVRSLVMIECTGMQHFQLCTVGE